MNLRRLTSLCAALLLSTGLLFTAGCEDEKSTTEKTAEESNEARSSDEREPESNERETTASEKTPDEPKEADPECVKKCVQKRQMRSGPISALEKECRKECKESGNEAPRPY